MDKSEEREFAELKGKTLFEIIGNVGDGEMVFRSENGNQYELYHDQDCFESVLIEDIVGCIEDLLGTPILLAEEVIHDSVNPDEVQIPEWQDSFTWTFYKLSTIKGSVTIRWYGSSNGFYSESVKFVQI